MRIHTFLLIAVLLLGGVSGINAWMNEHQYQPLNQILDDFQVNENSSGCEQWEPAVAMAQNGDFVAVWHDARNGNNDIHAQRYRSNGTKLGNNFQVNDDSGNSRQYNPAIGQDDNGNFVVVWVDYRNGDADVFAQRYSSSGNKLGSNFMVNDDDASTSQSSPKIGVDSNGNWVVVWRDIRNGDADIFAQRYNSSGNKLGNNFRVNDDTGGNWQEDPAIGIDGSGNFVVVWKDDRTSSRGQIYAQRYNSSGIKQGSNFLVKDESGSGKQAFPAVGLDNSGNFVVVWLDYGNYDIYAQRYNSSGIKQENNLRVNDENGSSGFDLTIGVDGSGNFVVVWQDCRNGNANADIYAQRYNDSGTRQGSNFKVNDDSGISYQYNPAVAVDGSGNFVAVWMDDRNGDFDIYAQRFHSSGNTEGSNFRMNDDSGIDQIKPAMGVADSGNFVVVWQDDRNGNNDIYAQRYRSVTEQGSNFRVNDDSGKNRQYDPAIGTDSSGNFVVVWQDVRNGYNIYAQQYLKDGTTQGVNFRVNDDSGTNYQYAPAVGVDNGGNFVIVWSDKRNGTDADIYAQQYSRSGVAQGCNFQVNDEGRYNQEYPAIGVDAIGNFVVAWMDHRHGAPNIYAQCYQSNGSKQGTNFQVNEAGAPGNPVIAVDRSGNFIIVWTDSDIYAQRYNSSGTKQGNNFKVNDSGAGSRAAPAVGIDHSGNFVVVWPDSRNGDWDIYGQVFNPAGDKISQNYRVHQATAPSDQKDPDVAFSNGMLYYTWQDNRVPGQGWDIFARVDSFVVGDSLIVEDATGGVGSTNNKVTIRLSNVSNISGIQFQLKPVPNELTFVSSQTTSRTTGFALSTNDLDSVVTCLLYHPSGNALTPGNESIIELFYNVSGTVQVGQQIQLKLQNVVVGDENALPLTVFQKDGVFTITETQGELSKDRPSTETALPTSFQLSQNYPNPFNPNTQIKYALPAATHVTLNIYNPQGQLIRQLVAARHEGGSYSVEWDGTNEARQPVSSGVYFYELQAGEFKEVRKMLLVR